MKNLLIIVIGISFMLLSCNAQETKKKEVDKSKTIQSENKKLFESTPVPKQLTSEEYIQIIHDFKSNPGWKFKGNKPCVVDFYADWCKPCKMMEPVMEKLAHEYEGKVNFYKVNVDDNKELSQVYGISSIPFFLFCPMNGQPQASMGMKTEDEMRKAIESILKQ